MHATKNKAAVLLTAGFLAVSAQATLVGQWGFNNASNLGEATIGTDLTWTGSPTATNGVSGGDGAVFSPKETYLTAANPIGGNGGGLRSNEYTLLIDFKLPIFNGWNPVFETSDPGGTSSDADYWISTSRGLGVASDGYEDDNDPLNSITAAT